MKKFNEEKNFKIMNPYDGEIFLDFFSLFYDNFVFWDMRILLFFSLILKVDFKVDFFYSTSGFFKIIFFPLMEAAQ